MAYGAVSNGNAYWVGHPGALKAAEAFRGGGQFVKKPLRVMRVFGLIDLLRFRFGLGPIHHVFRRISPRLKAEVAPLLASDGPTRPSTSTMHGRCACARRGSRAATGSIRTPIAGAESEEHTP